MLSSAKIGMASWRYYQQSVAAGACEYYTGAGEAAGRWYGRGLDQLGLPSRGLVVEAQLEGLFGRAIHPTTGARLGRGWRAGGVTGYDLTFSAPKSVSALWALADRELAGQLIAGHRAAVRASIDYLDEHAAYSRTGTDGTVQVGSAGLTVALFDHRTSRAGDPQLHTHALVLNKVRCPDGTWRTIDGAEVFRHKKSAGMLYQAALRAELTRRLGVTFTGISEHGQAEIAGIPADLLTRWSTRTGQVHAEANPTINSYQQTLGRELTGAERARVVKTAVLKTRPTKDHTSLETLHDRWAGQAAELGWTPGRLLQAVREHAGTVFVDDRAVTDRLEPTPGLPAAMPAPLAARALRAVGERQSVFGRAELAGQLAASLPAVPATADDVRATVEALADRALAGGEAVRLRDAEPAGPIRASDGRWTTTTLLGAEARILHRAAGSRGGGYAPVHPSVATACAEQAGLDADQQTAVLALTGGGDGIAVLVAPAGTGKTTTLAAAAHAWTVAGYPVVGLAPTARAAAELGMATSRPADTLAKWLYEQDRLPGAPAERRQAWAPTSRTVLFVDEAGMVGTADLDRLTGRAQQVGAKVVLVGDPAQLDPVRTAGGMLDLLAGRLNAPELSTVHRFTQPWEAAASRRLRAGDPASLPAYTAAGRIHPASDAPAALDAVFTHWTAETAAGRSVLMMARSRAEVDQLNDRARTAAQAAGTVHGPPLAGGPHDWRAGDVLLARRNDRTIGVGDGHLRNGDRFTVLAGTTDGGLLVDKLPGRGRALLPANYVHQHAEYGWASTIDAAQGATVDVGILLARPGIDREHLYVGLTRGRHANHVHVTPDLTEQPPNHPPAQPTLFDTAEEARSVLAAALANPRSQQSAHSRLVTAVEPPRATLGPPAEPAKDRELDGGPRWADTDELAARLRRVAQRADASAPVGHRLAEPTGPDAEAALASLRARQRAQDRDNAARRLREPPPGLDRGRGRSR